MVIECPECHVRFKVADEMIGDGPVKLKCGRCKVVFTFSRSASPAPASPEAPKPASPVVPPPAMPVPAPAPAPAPTPAVAPPAPAPAPTPDPAPAPETAPGDETPPQDASHVSLDEAYTSFEKEEEPPPAGPIEPSHEATASPVAEAAQEPAVAARAAQAAAVPSPGPVQASARPSRPPVITLEDVLPREEPPPRAAKAVGMSFMALIALGLLFAIFVLFRNGWDFTQVTSDPVQAVKVAVGAAPLAVVDPEARGLEISVYESYTAVTSSRTEVFVVNGEVFNSTVFPKKLVSMEVTIESATGEVVARQEATAGITLLTRDQLEKLGDIEIQERHVEDSRAAESWVIRSNRKGSFQAIFTTFPPGVGDPALYEVKAKVISATNAGAGEE